jgi:hypothetical protein
MNSAIDVLLASNCRVNRTFSPVLVDLFSIRIFRRNTHLDGDPGELIRFRLAPEA